MGTLIPKLKFTALYQDDFLSTNVVIDKDMLYNILFQFLLQEKTLVNYH